MDTFISAEDTLEQEEAEEEEEHIPPLVIYWFHAIDKPIVDPIAIRKAKREASFHISHPITPSTTQSNKQHPKNWVPFSKRDTIALEKAYQSQGSINLVSVNEDYLFEVDIAKREISPIYWEGPVFEVRRASWFMQGEGGKWIPCEEAMATQIEEGYSKHRPYVKPLISETEQDMGDPVDDIQPDSVESIKKEADTIEEREDLVAPYLNQYIVYKSSIEAWLLYDTTTGKIAKTFFTKFSNNPNLGGTRLLRGYIEVKREAKKKEEAEKASAPVGNTEGVSPKSDSPPRISTDLGDLPRSVKTPSKKKELEEAQAIRQNEEDYDNEESEEPPRVIDQVLFVIHGIGQQMSERLGQNFVHDVNILRKTIKSTYSFAVSGTTSLKNPNGIQVLPILWRKSIAFGSDPDDLDTLESDLGLPDKDDGCPTLAEITLEGAPNIRTLVTDVFMDIPLYFTSRYHDQMISVAAQEINRVYKLFIDRNPDFLGNNGQVSVIGHSLGSLLAFDIMTAQPLSNTEKQQASHAAPISNAKVDPLLFPIKNFFAIGSPLGMIMLLRSNKMVSRKALDPSKQHLASIGSNNPSNAVSFVYPAADHVYNIFHKSDPVAYRLEPLIVRHFSSTLKPEPIPYIKGGLKSVLDAGFNVGNDIALKANAMFESIRTNFNSSYLMRGLGFIRQGESSQNDAYTRSQTDPNMGLTRMAAKSEAKLKLLNPNGRVDFYLQEGLLENAYISALSVHMSYWADIDVAGFLIREVYKNQHMTEERGGVTRSVSV
ncbi:DDHD domain-containing protein [Pilobolus umbonatus]|nr:DDHD domain-containing protein [Pilobolus umbonatus]